MARVPSLGNDDIFCLEGNVAFGIACLRRIGTGTAEIKQASPLIIG